MKRFEDMSPEEQRYHVEEIHGVLYLRAEFVAITHNEDHERLDYPHVHEFSEATCKGSAGTEVV